MAPIWNNPVCVKSLPAYRQALNLTWYRAGGQPSFRKGGGEIYYHA